MCTPTFKPEEVASFMLLIEGSWMFAAQNWIVDLDAIVLVMGILMLAGWVGVVVGLPEYS